MMLTVLPESLKSLEGVRAPMTHLFAWGEALNFALTAEAAAAMVAYA